MKNDCINLLDFITNYFYKNKGQMNERKILIFFFFDKIGLVYIKLFFVLIVLVTIYKNKE